MEDMRPLIQIGIAKGQYPSRLYKYRTLDSAIRSLKEPSIYLASVLEFNDPYEAHYVLDSNNSVQQWTSFLEQQGVPSAIAVAKAKQLSYLPKEAAKIQKEEIDKILQNSGVFCFSKLNDSILMWSYYTDNHRGVCIEYDPIQDEQLCNLLLPVKYSDDYIKFNYLTDQEGPKNAILQKAECWAHEEELRMIWPQKAGTILKLNPHAITSVILGCNFNEPLKDKEKELEFVNKRKGLLDLLKEPRYSHVKIKQCTLADDKYKLIIK